MENFLWSLHAWTCVIRSNAFGWTQSKSLHPGVGPATTPFPHTKYREGAGLHETIRTRRKGGYPWGKEEGRVPVGQGGRGRWGKEEGGKGRREGGEEWGERRVRGRSSNFEKGGSKYVK